MRSIEITNGGSFDREGEVFTKRTAIETKCNEMHVAEIHRESTRRKKMFMHSSSLFANQVGLIEKNQKKNIVALAQSTPFPFILIIPVRFPRRIST